MSPTGKSDKLAWERIVELQPTITSLLLQAELGGDAQRWSAIKRELSRRVGWHAEEEELRTTEAYDVAYARLRRAFEEAGGRF